MEGSMITFGTVSEVLDLAKVLSDAAVVREGEIRAAAEHILVRTETERAEIALGGLEGGRAPELQGSWRLSADAEPRKRVMQAPRKTAGSTLQSAHAERGNGTGRIAPPGPPPSITKHGATGALITWASPEPDNGGPVTAFEVEMKRSTGALGWTLIYYGIATTYTVTGLAPGIQIGVRVRAINGMRKSGWSGEAHFCTLPDLVEAPPAPYKKKRKLSVLKTRSPPPVAPEPPVVENFCQVKSLEVSPCTPPPKVVKTTSSSLTLKWEVPNQDSSSTVCKYTLEMLKETETLLAKESNFTGGKKHEKKKLGKHDAVVHMTTRVWDPVYDGHGLWYAAEGLSPGNEYRFRVRAHNTLDTFPPSSTLVARTLPAAPGAPQPPTFIRVTPTSVQIKWSSPACNNGMPVTSYKLMLDDGQGGRLCKAYEGAATSYKASKLVPSSSYRVAVQAINALGASDVSGVAVVELPVAPPSTPPTAEVELPDGVKAKQLWSPRTWWWASVAGVCAIIVAASVLSVY